MTTANLRREAIIKYALVFGIAIFCIAADQWTKHLASSRLATARPGWFEHYVVLTVPPELDGATTRELIEHEFGGHNSPEEISDILTGVTNDGAVLLAPGRKLAAGDVVEVRQREIVVIPGYFDLQYARNTGAAFSFLADADSSWRTPFFVGFGVVAIIVILWILHGVALNQILMVLSLALVCGGAIGNLIDRVRLGYVVDFIVWKWTDAYRWPTFNLADAFIVVGVALMIVEMLRDTIRERRQKKA